MDDVIGNHVLWEISFIEFFFVTIVFGGGAAYLSGRVVAISWQSVGQLFIYVLLLSAATRFIHFSLFHGTLLTLHYFIVDFIILLICGFLGMRLFRARQMTTQYRFAFKRSGLLSWKPRI